MMSEKLLDQDHFSPLHRGFSDMPDEICLIVFKMLERRDLVGISGTCKRLRQLALDPALWKELTADCSTLNSFLAFADRLESVESIRFQNKQMEPVSEPLILQLVLKFKTTLTKLGFSDEVSISGSTVEKLGKLVNLKSLEMAGSHISTNSLLALSKLQELEDISLPSSTKLKSSDLILFFKKTSKLRMVDISDNQAVVNTKVMTALAENNRGLEYLVVDESENINSASLKPISDYCRDLQHLSLESCDGITDTSLVNLVKNCKLIRYLSLGMCRGLTCKSLKAIAENLEFLEHLDLYGCTFIREKSVQTILEKCVNMKYINLRGIPLDTKFIEKCKEKYKEKNIEIVFYAPTTSRSRMSCRMSCKDEPILRGQQTTD